MTSDCDLNQGVLHPWSEFGNSSLNGWQVITHNKSGFTHPRTNTQAEAGNDNTRRPELDSEEKLTTHLYTSFQGALPYRL